MVSKGKQFKNNRPQERQKAPGDYEQKLLDVARVARVTAGGRRFSFRVVIIIGDRAGKVAIGVRKGRDVQFAVEKAVRAAKKDFFTVPMTDTGTLHHSVYGKFGSSLVFLKPAAEGRGIRAGGAVRAVCDLAGYKNVSGKILSRSGNKLNVARATLVALKKIKVPKKPIKTEKVAKEKSEKGETKKGKEKATPKGGEPRSDKSGRVKKTTATKKTETAK